MSHFSVLVVGDNVEDDLAPYDENLDADPYKSYEEIDPDRWPVRALVEEDPTLDISDPSTIAQLLNERYEYKEGDPSRYYADEEGLYTISTYNPQSKWDYWRVGGRWAGHWVMKSGRKGQMADLAWEFTFNPEDEVPDFTDRADVACKGDIDFDRMRDKAEDAAREEWTKAHKIISTHGPLPDSSWKDEGGPWDDERKAKKEAYWSHPTVVAIRDANLIGLFGWPDGFDCTLEEYVQRARDGAITTFALVYNGEWIEPGSMGWWGMSSDTPESRDEYARKFNEIIDGLPDDTMLTVVDCHI